MNAQLKSEKKETPTYKEREHRFTKLPVKDLLKVRMDDLEVKNITLQKAMGYSMPNVIAMMRNGSMRVPLNQTLVLSEVLKLDPIFLLGKLIEENDASLWTVIKSVMGRRLVTANEMALIELTRKHLDGYDVDLTEEEELVQVLVAGIKEIAKREVTNTRATKTRIARGD